MKIAELNEHDREHYINEYREHSLDWDWYDWIEEGFGEDLKEKGIEIHKDKRNGGITFDIYHHQAAFTGRVYTDKEIEKFFTTHNLKEQHPLIYYLNEHYKIIYSIKFTNTSRGHQESEVNYDVPNEEEWENDLGVVLNSNNKTFEEAQEEFEAAVKEIAEEHASELLKRLTDAYEEMNTDEYIMEEMEANDMDFEPLTEEEEVV